MHLTIRASLAAFAGLVQLTGSSQRTWELMGTTLADGSMAILIILAMSFGLVVPKSIIDYVSERATKSRFMKGDVMSTMEPSPRLFEQRYGECNERNQQRCARERVR